MWMLVQEGEPLVVAWCVAVLTAHLWGLFSSPVGYCRLGL